MWKLLEDPAIAVAIFFPLAHRSEVIQLMVIVAVLNLSSQYFKGHGGSGLLEEM